MSMTWFALPPPVELGEGWSLGFLTAAEMLACRGEGEAMAGEERDKALWANAALLSKVLLKEGQPAFESGEKVISSLTVGQIEGLTRRWWQQDDFSPQPLREEWSAREGGENERFDMARFLELGGTAEEPFRDLALEGTAPARDTGAPGLWPRSSLPVAGALPEVQRACRRPYAPPGAAVPPRGGRAGEAESPGPPADGRAGEEPFWTETHRVVQAVEPGAVQESAGLTVGELDRAVERDARRYGGGFSLL